MIGKLLCRLGLHQTWISQSYTGLRVCECVRAYCGYRISLNTERWRRGE